MARTAGKAASWGAIGALCLSAALNPTGCVEGADTDLIAAAVGDALADAGPEVVLPALEAFNAEAALLEEALYGWQDGLLVGDGDTARAAAQAQWRATMAAWQAVEVMQIGPAASSLTAIGGEDLRDEIYSWPTVNPCRVDQETVEEAWGDADYFEANLVNSYGLDALEWLLFAGPETECPSQVGIDGDWDALGADGVTANRAAFAAALAAHVRAEGEALYDIWSGGFSEDLRADDGSPYASEQEALNAIFDALFYLETSTKDRKLALPLGYDDCADDTCAEEAEGLLSETSFDAIRANLSGFRALYTGGEGAGLDDLLVDLGHAELSEQILADLDAAEAAAEALDGAMDDGLAQDPEAVAALHDAIKIVTDALKGDLATVLSLELPSEAAGDND